jgi:hypothetical protein
MQVDIMKDIETEVRELDKRLNHVEAIVNTILKSMENVEKVLDKVTTSQQQLELKLAWAAGAIAVATIIAQISIQGIFAFVN